MAISSVGLRTNRGSDAIMEVRSNSGEAVGRSKTGSTFKNHEDDRFIVNHQRREMKNKVFNVVISFCLLTLATAATANAQAPDHVLRARIPFGFSVRDRTLPAGEYEVRRLNDSPEVLIISKRSRHEHEQAIFRTDPLDASRTPNRGEIVFHRYGDRYFLSEVLTGGEQTGRVLAPTREERSLRRELASRGGQSEPETVALAVY
jgi:hypothetical protein